jgi:pimeloyl-ACP methyl ester carboxylesterase
MITRQPHESTGGREETVIAPDGVALSVREWGNPNGSEILFIHGLAQCHLAFRRQTDSELAKRHRIVAFDLRGHGCSAKPLEPHFYQNGRVWADDVATVIAAKRLARPVLVGWSLGGRVLRQYLMHYGDERLSAINFLATRPIEHPSVTGPGSHAIRGSGELDFGPRLMAEIGFLRDCYAKQPELPDLLLAVAYNTIMPRAVRDAIAGWSTDAEATTVALNKVRVPTLITHGRLDRLILPRAAEMTAAAVRGARISWFDDCGHSPFYEDAPRYNRELDGLITGTQHDVGRP